jgi:hypothetical protein
MAAKICPTIRESKICKWGNTDRLLTKHIDLFGK